MGTMKFSVWLALVAVIISPCYSQDDEFPVPQDQTNRCEGSWGQWENWSRCSGGCRQPGYQIRSRPCEHPARPVRCERRNLTRCTTGQNSESQFCYGDCGFFSTLRPTIPPTIRPTRPTQPPSNGRDECRVGNRRGGWGEWGCWGRCAFRQRSRYRECNRPRPVGNGNYCNGSNTQTEFCYDDGFFNPTTIARPTDSPLCTRGQDVAFAIDSSGSIGTNNFRQMTDELLNIIRNFDLEQSWNRGDSRKTRVALMTFATTATVRNHLDEFDIPQSLPYFGGGTNTGNAIDMARDTIFNYNNGDRSGNSNVLIVLTDGRSNDRSRTIAAAVRAKSDRIRIYAFGIGNNLDRSELNSIASDPSYVYIVRDFDDLTRELNEVFRC